MGVHSGYNSFLLKQKENPGSVTATFRDMHTFSEILMEVENKQPVRSSKNLIILLGRVVHILCDPLDGRYLD